MLQDQTPLSAVREYEREQAAEIAPESRPLIHLTPMVGWMNDPNGFCYYQGEYHLFYQYYPYNTVWGPMHWGHARTRDLLHWTYVPAAMAPDTVADAGGVFSGSAVAMPDGRLMLMYTGVQPATTGHPDLQAQCVAFGDGVNFVKAEQNPVIAAQHLPEGYSAVDFRDPKIWRGEDGKLYCVAGNRHAQREGAILLFESEDGLDWRFVTELAASCGQLGRMWECPDFFRLDGEQVLLTSPQEMQASPDGEFHAGYGTVALLGDYDEQTHTFTRRVAQPIDCGLDFYAPQTTLAPDGRRVMVAWMENWETVKGSMRKHKWFGRMTLPREISIKNGKLCQQPVREIETIWQDEVRVEGVQLDGTQSFAGVAGRMIDMTVTASAQEGGARRFVLRFAQDEHHFTEVSCALTRGELIFDRNHCGSSRDIPHLRRVKVAMAERTVKLRLILDKDSVELFVGDGERVLSALINTPMTAEAITFTSDGPLTLDVVKHALG